MWFTVEKNTDKTYSLTLTDAFYEKMYPYYCGGSYWNIMYRLFNMLPQVFYHYVGFVYNASFKKSDSIRHIYMFWVNKDDAKKFCEDLNARFDTCVKRGDFNS